MLFKTLLYGSKYWRYRIYDIALDLFECSDFISFDRLQRLGNELPTDFRSVMDFLSDQKLVKQTELGFEITELGKNRRRFGGFVRKLLWERLQSFALIVSVVAGLISIFFLFTTN